jgi:peptide/nickel transport system substrate-binding protein
VATEVLSLLAVAFALAACTSSDRDSALGRGSTVVLATADESGFLPTYTSLEAIPFSPLLAWNQDDTREPRLASSWESSPDGRRRTYHLRTDVRWHDGEPFTSRDVKYTLDLLDHPEVLGLAGAGLDSVRIIDDSTVTLVGVRPSYLDDILIYPEHLLGELNPADIWSWQFWMRPVGTGPFRSVRYVPETLMEFEANPDYFRGKPRLERLIVKFVGGGKIPEILSGNADIVDHARSEDWTQIEGDGRFLVVNIVYYSGGAMGLYLNHDHVLFSDSRVRRAVALAIDRREILRALALPADIALFDVPMTPRQGRRRDFPASLPYDPGRATKILEEVGWRDTDGDGVRERNGFPARFQLISRSPPRAVLVQEHLRRVGLDAEILNVEPGVVQERVDLGAFDAVIHVVQDNTDWLLHHFGRDAVTGYLNPRVAELLEVAATSSLDDSVDATYAELGEIFQRDLPLIYLQPWITTQFVHRRIKGPRMPFTGNLLRQLDELWVEEW